MSDGSETPQFTSIEEQLAAMAFNDQRARESDETARQNEHRELIATRESEIGKLSNWVEKLSAQIDRINLAVTQYHAGHTQAVNHFNDQ